MKNEIIGKRFCRLVVDSSVGVINKNSHYKCYCDCGSEVIVSRPNLKSGHTKSCGCLNIDRLKNRSTHGMSKTKIYGVWNTMIQRCDNKHSYSYERYGGRGISVCTQWHSFDAFYDWAKDNGYKSGLTIDRINNDGNYEPSNCRWATPTEQANNRSNPRYWARNKRSNNTSGVIGVCFDNSRRKWVAQIGYKGIGYKIKRFNTKYEAISQRKEWEKIMIEAGIKKDK